MQNEKYLTSDIFEASTLVVYDQPLIGIHVDRSKDRPEALFEFKNVDALPSQYRAGKLLVDPHSFRKVMIELRKSMFSKLDEA